MSQGLEEEKMDSSNPMNPGNFKKVKLIPDKDQKLLKEILNRIAASTKIDLKNPNHFCLILNDRKVEKMLYQIDCKSDLEDLYSYLSNNNPPKTF